MQPQVLSERNREIKALEKEKHSLAKRISGADVFASPRPHTSSHPSTPARVTPRAVGDAQGRLQLLASPAAACPRSPVADVELLLSPPEAASGGALSPGLGAIDEANGVCGEEALEVEREMAEEEKRRRLELKAIDSEVMMWIEVELW